MTYHAEGHTPAEGEVRVSDVAPEWADKWFLCTDGEFRPASHCWFTPATPKGAE